MSQPTSARRRPIAQHGRLKKRGAFGNLFRFIGITLAVVVVATASVSGIAILDLANEVNGGGKSVTLQPLPGDTPPTVGSVSGAVNMLLVGTDTRTGQGKGFDSVSELAGSSGIGNNDVTILIHIAADHQSAMVVSFPRDTIVTMPACPSSNGGSYPPTTTMLNGALVRGGLSCPVLTIEKMTGLSIPYAAQISFDGVAAMSDAVGGVDVCVATRIDDPEVGLHLSAGQHALVGGEALAFLRSRHGIADGSDLGRISSQEVFLSSLVRKIESGGVLSNPLQLYSLASAAVNHMTLSSTLEHVDTLVAIAGALKGIPLAHIVMMQYPTQSDPANPNRVIPSIAGDLAVNAALLSNERVKLSGTTGRGSVAEGTAKSGSSSTATPTPTSSSSPDKSITLPASVTGQNAGQETCAKGNG